jgi:phosphoglycerate dehydrogenase-like enzyme
MRAIVARPTLRVAFAGTFSVCLEERVRAYLGMPCDVIRADEVEIVSRLPEVDILVTMAFTPEMGAAGRRLKLVQVPGAGLDRIDRSALPTGAWLRTIAGAALDVWYQYPKGPDPSFPARHGFQGLPNVLMTPHVSGWTEGMLEARAKLIADNIHRAAHGQPPVNLIPASAA